MSEDVELYGVAFMSLYQHDGRFVRGGGVFAFARRDLDGGRTILHLEPVADISRAADSTHPRWDWAVEHGMNELLVHLAGSQQTPGELAPGVGSPPIRWQLHPDELAAEGGPIDERDALADQARLYASG
ncbi:MAG: hypothetical protein B7Y81_00630 [Caulobacter sp. 32-67-35]|nr:MAG: hypothetical protein B7Y81_00630 [Caulobacter sp. 32-67-35]OZA74024.1 MAG: hypothetical protein B7X77_09035 [Caulobacter sp. 39-67-4]HQR90619.1 hypothetical protein [Caulobacter sp.]